MENRVLLIEIFERMERRLGEMLVIARHGFLSNANKNQSTLDCTDSDWECGYSDLSSIEVHLQKTSDEAALLGIEKTEAGRLEAGMEDSGGEWTTESVIPIAKKEIIKKSFIPEAEFSRRLRETLIQEFRVKGKKRQQKNWEKRSWWKKLNQTEKSEKRRKQRKIFRMKETKKRKKKRKRGMMENNRLCVSLERIGDFERRKRQQTFIRQRKKRKKRWNRKKKVRRIKPDSRFQQIGVNPYPNSKSPSFNLSTSSIVCLSNQIPAVDPSLSICGRLRRCSASFLLFTPPEKKIAMRRESSLRRRGQVGPACCFTGAVQEEWAKPRHSFAKQSPNQRGGSKIQKIRVISNLGHTAISLTIITQLPSDLLMCTELRIAAVERPGPLSPFLISYKQIIRKQGIPTSLQVWQIDKSNGRKVTITIIPFIKGHTMRLKEEVLGSAVWIFKVSDIRFQQRTKVLRCFKDMTNLIRQSRPTLLCPVFYSTSGGQLLLLALAVV